MKQRIIYVQWTNNFGGLEKISQDYEKIFDDNYQIRVLPLRYKEDGLRYNYEVVLKYHNHKILLYFDYYLFVLKNKECIYHLQYPGSKILLLTYLAAARKIIFHFHGTQFRTNFFDRLVWKFMKNRTTLIANSSYTQSVIMSRLTILKAPIVIANMINPGNFPYCKRKLSEKFIITYAGRFTKGKNLKLIIETAKLLRKDNFEFHLYGDGPEKENLVNFVTEEGLQPLVFFHAFAQDINKVFQGSKLFLFLSAYESFGNVVAESIMTGLPVLCNKIPALQEFINDESFFVQHLEPQIIADKIIHIANNYNTITEQILILSERVRHKLNPENIANSLNRIYHKLELEA